MELRQLFDELQPASEFISSELPPWEVWATVRQQIGAETAKQFEDKWRWVGRSLGAFFSDTSDPVPFSGLPESTRNAVLVTTNFYSILAVLLFQAEKFLRAEARVRQLPLPQRRSELLALWALEHCQREIHLLMQSRWESHSGKQSQERSRDTRKFVRGEILEERMKLQVTRWQKEDTKLQRDTSPTLSFIKLCMDVFSKYQAQLPAFESYLKATDTLQDGKKYVGSKGRVNPYPGRGKGKKRS